MKGYALAIMTIESYFCSFKIAGNETNKFHQVRVVLFDCACANDYRSRASAGKHPS